MALTNEQETTKDVANKAYEAGEQIMVELNAMLQAIEPMLAGRFQGSAAKSFDRIQAEIAQQVDILNKELDGFAENLIKTTDGLSMSDLDLDSALQAAAGDNDTATAYEQQLGGKL